MALQSVGLYTHIRNNNITSGFLLAMFPVILIIIIWIIGFGVEYALSTEAAQYGKYKPATINTMLEAGFRAVVNYGHVALAIALAWVGIASLFHEKLIDIATGARTVTRGEYPELYNLLENLCISRGLPTPKLGIINSPALNAFASGISDKSYRISVTKGLLETLDKNELEAVLAHELTHIINKDVRLLIISTVFVGMLSFITEMLGRSLRHSGRAFSSSGRGKKGGGAIIIIALVAVAIGYVMAILVRFSLSRTREYLADAGAVELTKNPGAMASALKKISGRAELDKVPDEVMQMFIDNPPAFSSIFSTHPSIESRLEALKKMGSTHYTPDEPFQKASAERTELTGYDILKQMKQKKREELTSESAFVTGLTSSGDLPEAMSAMSASTPVSHWDIGGVGDESTVGFRDSVDSKMPEFAPHASFWKSPMVMLSIIFMLVGTGLVFGGFFTFQKEKAFEENGMLADGTVDNTWTERTGSGDNRSTDYYVKYTFRDDNGISRVDSGTVSSSMWRTLMRGSKIKVQFLKGGGESRVYGSGLGMVGSLLLALAGFAFLSGGVYFPFSFARREGVYKNLTQSGKEVKGSITKIDSSRMEINKVPYSRISYEYKDIQGVTHTGKTRYLRLSLADDFKIGASIRVWYDPKDSARNISEIG